MKTHRHVLRFPVFSNYKVVVVFTADLAREALKWSPPDKQPNEMAAAVTITNSDGLSTVILPHRPDAETVAHEAYHVVAAMLAWIGASQEEEVIAYHLGYLVKHIDKWGKR